MYFATSIPGDTRNNVTMNLDNIFGIHAQAAQLRAYRAEVLANNIANAETPNYKARDIDFKDILKNIGGMDTVRSVPRHDAHINLSNSNTLKNDLLYRTPSQASLDGNTVDMDIEKSEFSSNAMAYQVSMTFLSSRIKNILTAIRGE